MMSWDAAICVPQLALPGVGDVDERGGLQPGSPEVCFRPAKEDAATACSGLILTQDSHQG